LFDSALATGGDNTASPPAPVDVASGSGSDPASGPGSDPVDATFAMSQLQFLGHSPN
jgi:hypothetical protein